MVEPAIPRLPLPGMLRDGPAPRAADFRKAPRPAAGPAKPAGAMQPPKGMIPPKLGRDAEHDPARIRPGDTASLVAEVAVELMKEVESASTSRGDTEESGIVPAAAPLSPAEASTAAASTAAVSGSSRSSLGLSPGPAIALDFASSAPPKAPPRRKGAMFGLGALLGGSLLLLLGWLALREPEPEPEVVTAAGPTTPAAASDEPGESDPPEALAAAGGSTGAEAGSTGGESSGSTGEGSSTGDADESTGESTGDDDASGEPGDDEGDEGPVASKSRSGGSRSKPKPKPKSTPKADPKPSASSAPKSEPPDATKLLAQAKAAYRGGKGSTAYSLASKSNRLRPSGEAAEVMALAACAMKNAGKAKSALKQVPLLRRPSVRSTCKSKHDLRLGL